MSDKDTLQAGPYILDLDLHIIQALGLSEADALSAVEARAMEHMSSLIPKNYTGIGTDLIINQQLIPKNYTGLGTDLIINKQLVDLLGVTPDQINKLIPHIAEGKLRIPEQTKEYLANNGVDIGL